MTTKLVQCAWCDREFFPNELRESRFLGGLICRTCDADEPGRTLGEIHKKLKGRATERGVGWVK